MYECLKKDIYREKGKMANYTKNNLPRLDIQIHDDEYWDFYLNHESLGNFMYLSDHVNTECLASFINTTFDECRDGDNLQSLPEYSYSNACNTNGLRLENIGFTGVDNGLISYDRDRITNQEFYDIFTKSVYEIEPEDYRLKLHAVTGNTKIYDYQFSFNDDKTVKLNGGFFQGFFRSGDKYSVLPSDFNEGNVWGLEFTLKPEDYVNETARTLNDKYPENKGIFFYIGTRAENKWMYLYEPDLKYNGETTEFGKLDIDKKNYIINNFYKLNDVELSDLDGVLKWCGFCRITGDTPLEEYDYIPVKTYCGTVYVRVPRELPLDGWFGECPDEPEEISVIDIDSDNNITISASLPNGQYSLYYEDEEGNILPNVDKIGTIIKTETESEKNEESNDNIINDEEFDLVDDTDYIEDEVDISEVEYITTNGFRLDSSNDGYILSDNKFLMYDRTCTGLTVDNSEGNEQVLLAYKKKRFNGNLFLFMNRTKTGYTVNDISVLKEEASKTYDSFYKDIWNNALAFRITEDGKVGYRYLVKDCDAVDDNQINILEGYSNPGVINKSEWSTIHVKLWAKASSMQMYFYVNGKLKYITEELPLLKLHALNDIEEKQEGVPYNISLGGGTQGLSETVMPNYMLDPSRIYPLEKNFAGTFIGDFKSFKFYECSQEQLSIWTNHLYELNDLKKWNQSNITN